MSLFIRATPNLMDKQIINSLKGIGPALQGICALLFFRLFRFCSFKKILENSLQRHGHRLPFFIGILFESLIYQAVDVVVDMATVFFRPCHTLSRPLHLDLTVHQHGEKEITEGREVSVLVDSILNALQY